MAIRPDRIHEIDIAVPALRILAAEPYGTLRASELIQQLEELLLVHGSGVVPVDGSDTLPLAHVVRTIATGRNKGLNFIRRGFATYSPRVFGVNDGEIAITLRGLDLLEILGFKVKPALRALVMKRDVVALRVVSWPRKGRDAHDDTTTEK